MDGHHASLGKERGCAIWPAKLETGLSENKEAAWKVIKEESVLVTKRQQNTSQFVILVPLPLYFATSAA